MGRSQETAGKKEVKNRKDKKRKEKEQKRARKKTEGGKSNFEDMIAYVDEYGVISSTPPDPAKKKAVSADSIELNVSKLRAESARDTLKKGVVSFFNESKGFGFIRDLESGQRIFVHVKSIEEPIAENNLVSYEIAKGPKGPSAIKVKIFREETAAPQEETPVPGE